MLVKIVKTVFTHSLFYVIDVLPFLYWIRVNLPSTIYVAVTKLKLTCKKKSQSVIAIELDRLTKWKALKLPTDARIFPPLWKTTSNGKIYDLNENVHSTCPSRQNA